MGVAPRAYPGDQRTTPPSSRHNSRSGEPGQGGADESSAIASYGRWGEVSEPALPSGFTAEHDYETRCACGNEWWVRLEYDEDAMAMCLACGPTRSTKCAA